MILVTGSNGLVGSHLLYYLLSKGKEVRALIRSSKAKDSIYDIFSFLGTDYKILFERIKWVIGDVTDTESLEEAFTDIEKVYHCAAYISFNEKDFSLMKKVNVKGTAKIVNLCLNRNIKKLIHVSSIAAIGKSPHNDIITEDGNWPQGKMSPYSYTKTQSELEVWRGISEGLDAVIVNPSVILGPGNWNTGSGKLISKVASGMKFYTEGVTGFVDIADVVKAMYTLMESTIKNERFIINEGNYSYKKIFELIADNLGVKPPRYSAGKGMTELAWRMEKFLSVVFRKPATLTKWSARTAHRIQNYSSNKLLEQVDFHYSPIEQTISRIAKIYLKDDTT